MLKTLFWHVLRKKTLLRALHNVHLTGRSYTGYGIDIGAKNEFSSYYSFVNLDIDKITFTDLHPMSDNTIFFDFEEVCNLSTPNGDKFDYALCFNVLEHIYNHQNLVSSVYLSLKPDGVFEGFVPFMHHYHADPDDYFRYTHSYLHRMLDSHSFKNIEVTPIGVGIFTVCCHIFSRLLYFRPLIYFAWIASLNLDKILTKFWPHNKKYYSGLSFTCRK